MVNHIQVQVQMNVLVAC